MPYHGGIQWIGDSGAPQGQQTISLVRSIATPSTGQKMLDLRGSMLAHSECNTPVVIMVSTYPQTPSTPPGVGANINKRALIYFRDPSDQKVYHFDYPCPIAAEIESTPTGNIIKQATVVIITGYLSTCFGRTLVPLYGVYLQRI